MEAVLIIFTMTWVLLARLNAERKRKKRIERCRNLQAKLINRDIFGLCGVAEPAVAPCRVIYLSDYLEAQGGGTGNRL